MDLNGNHQGRNRTPLQGQSQHDFQVSAEEEEGGVGGGFIVGAVGSCFGRFAFWPGTPASRVYPVIIGMVLAGQSRVRRGVCRWGR